MILDRIYRVLRKIFGPKRGEVTAKYRTLLPGSFMICPSHQIFG